MTITEADWKRTRASTLLPQRRLFTLRLFDTSGQDPIDAHADGPTGLESRLGTKFPKTLSFGRETNGTYEPENYELLHLGEEPTTEVGQTGLARLRAASTPKK